VDLRQLRYFLTIVEQGSFSKAAVTLRVAQPALSLHVQNMEAELGTALLFRGPRGVVTTEAGDILMRNARAIVDQFAVARDEIRGHEATPAGDVRLGLPGTISQVLSVPLIIEARRRFPQIRLRIAEAMSGFVLEWIKELRVDLAVLYIPVEDGALVSTPILTEALWLLGPVAAIGDLPRLPAGSVDYVEIAKLPLILPSASHGLRELLEREGADRDLTLNTVVEVDSYANIKGLVEAGIGYSILPFNSIAQEVLSGRLQAWQISQPELKRAIHLVKPTDRPVTKAVLTIEALCREILLDLAAKGKWSGARAL
jgi:LysR family transcriptional regulator, nitrogen assimilation regulatory protein